MTYLYLLPFKDGVHFKLGISKSLDGRISNHANNFDLDPNKGLYVTANKSVFILSLEQELLLLLEDPKYPHYCDGYTEIRLMKDFEKVLSYIDSKSDFLGFKIEEYNIIIKSKRKKETIKNTLVKTEKAYLNPIERLRKELDISQVKISDHLNIKQYQYNRMERNSKLSDSMKTKVICFFITECNNHPYSRESLGISQKRLARLLGMQYTHLCSSEKSGKEIKGLKEALESEYNRRMDLKKELHEMLNLC